MPRIVPLEPPQKAKSATAEDRFSESEVDDAVAIDVDSVREPVAVLVDELGHAEIRR
jgi:hypothetical protein